MVSVQIKMMIAMDQDEKKYVGNLIYLGNYNDNGEAKKIKIMLSIQIKMMMMDQDNKDFVWFRFTLVIKKMMMKRR